MLRRPIAALVLAVVGGLAGCGDDAPPAPTSAAPSTPPAAGAPAPVVMPVEPSYPDTAQGLEAMMTALVKALQDGDEAEQTRLLQSLQLPAVDGWFREVFGPSLGPELLAEHEPQRAGIGWLAGHIKGRIETGLTAIHAEKFDAPGQPGAVGYQSEALARMQQRVPLYSVRFSSTDGKRTWHVWSFVHHRGTFRYVGKMRRVASRPPPADGRDPLEYRLSDAARVKASMGAH
ncbi:MAG TPA: hypothetical protein VK698_39010 [Kofleriaceae bacterium]|nr:hypothetical protein [Kofleriaceae bacterium]